MSELQRIRKGIWQLGLRLEDFCMSELRIQLEDISEDLACVIDQEIKNDEILKSAMTLLNAAVCPQCDGSGTVEVLGVDIQTECCGNPIGYECCGSPIPVQVQVPEQAPCQWCYERDELKRQLNE